MSNPDIQKFLKDNHMFNGTDLMTYYSSKILEIMTSIGGKSMVWQDVWDDGVKLPPETVIEIWKDTSLLPNSSSWSYYLSKATSEGYDAVLAAPFYLNM
jgi:hexosaminidase